ncbi:MAG: ATP-binding cassette domain-containing protein [Candidatus Micrarchaeota archaeon]|nr:ATP-binding cassette domain-containing protein [Candidatus Micrarchaeota archaeon]
MEMIQINNLTKKFNSLAAVDSVSFSVSEGEIFALLGPNGAGKTTLISMLVTMRKPTSGSASVNNFDISENPDDVRKSIGIVFQDQSLDEELTAYENLELHAAMYGVEKKEREARISEVMKMVELDDRLHSIVKTFIGKTEDLKNSLGGDSILVETENSEKLCALLQDFDCKGKPKTHDGSLTLYVEHGEKKIPKIVELASKHGIHISSVVLHKPTLDDVFLHYTGKTIREEEAGANEGIRGRVRARRMR